jgi:uncharacterized protein with LGFP repeats
MSEIDDKYDQLGGAGGFLGQPTEPERPTPNGLGRYRHYQGGSIYWHQGFPFEAFVVYGLIRQKWSQMGWEQSPLGFPLSDEMPAGSAGGRMSVFERGAILYRPDIGTFETHGAISRRWRDVGGINNLGFPLTDELTTPDTRGRYNHFERGSIYWTPQTGAHEVTADIKNAWADSGWEQGPVGYPVSTPARMPTVSTDFQDFERGTIYAFGLDSKFVIRPRTSVFATSEIFINWNSFGITLPDADIISVAFAQNFPSIGVRLTLNAGPGITWWKALSVFVPGRGDVQEIFTQDATTTATTRLDPSIFDAGYVYLHFKKAKVLGVHTGMYLLPRADRLIGTHATFTWLKDRV